MGYTDIARAIRSIRSAIAGSQEGKVTSLNDTQFSNGSQIEVIGIPEYVSDVSEYSQYGITEKGWYIFARIEAEEGVTVTENASVTGADGYIFSVVGEDHVYVAIRFDVTAMSKVITVNWGDVSEKFVFKATDLAVRNLDYRTTFYIYDLAPFVTWSYDFTADTTFQANKDYYTEANGTYAKANVETVTYVLTTDETFQANKTYYTKDGDEYTAAEVTVGEAVPAVTYYEQTTVPVPAYYKDGFVLTTDTTFQDGITYYILSDGQYVEATVTTGEAVTPDTYYVTAKVRATGVFQDGGTYYTKSGSEYTEATVTAGEAIPAYYNHSKLHIEGMARNVTYKLDDVVDCPSEIVLPAIEDDGHGAWFEIRFRHSGSYSSTLLPQDPDVKIATEHTQAETAGINMVDLHYQSVAGVKLWRFLNTHSTIPTT